MIEYLEPDTDRIAIVLSMLADAGLPTHDVRETNTSLYASINDQTISGAVGLQDLGNVALLRSLIVSPAHRGQGLGHALTDFARREALTRNFEALYLLTESAESFFEKHGYKSIARANAPAVVHETPQFSKLCPGSAQLMYISLTS